MKPIDDYIYNEDDLPLDQNTVAELSIECKFQKNISIWIWISSKKAFFRTIFAK